MLSPNRAPMLSPEESGVHRAGPVKWFGRTITLPGVTLAGVVGGFADGAGRRHGRGGCRSSTSAPR